MTTKYLHPQFILAVDNQYFKDRADTFKQGLTSFDYWTWLEQVQPHLTIRQRNWLDGDKGVTGKGDVSYRQILPYVVFTQTSEEGTKKVIVYRRTSKVGESRLAKGASIGFGGHIDLVDVIYDPITSVVNLEQTILKSTLRELSEELLITVGGAPVRLVDMDIRHATQGIEFLIDDLPGKKDNLAAGDVPVGQLHIGLVLKIELPSDWVVSCPEEELDIVGPVSLPEIYNDPTLEFEPWSKAIINSLLTQ